MKHSYEFIKNEFEKKNYTLVSDTYINNKTPMEYICNKHKNRGIQKITYNGLRQGQECIYCTYESGKHVNKIPEDIIKEKVEERGYIYKGLKYVDGASIVDFICKEHVDKGIQSKPWASIRIGCNVCSYCTGRERTTEEFQSMVNEIFDNVEVIGEYTGTSNRIKCRCTTHDYVWEPYGYNLLSGYGCPKCGSAKSGFQKRVPVDEKIKRLHEIHPDIEFLSYPILSSDYVDCKCKKCGGVWKATYMNLTKYHKRTNCPYCNSSTGEERIATVLDTWGFKYERQKRYDDCRDYNTLPFDFYLPNNNLLIEFDGEQHYQLINRTGMSIEEQKEEFEKIQYHDSIKTEYCKNNNIPLLRIPYWERDDLEYFLFDQFVRLGIIEEIKMLNS